MYLKDPLYSRTLVPEAGISGKDKHLPLYDAITYLCPRYLLLVPKFSFIFSANHHNGNPQLPAPAQVHAIRGWRGSLAGQHTYCQTYFVVSDCFILYLLYLTISGQNKRLFNYCELFLNIYYDVIKWKHFPRYWPFVRGIHRSPVNSPHKGQWRGALMFSLICAWINGWVNNREAGALRRHRTHYDVTVMNGSSDSPYFVLTGRENVSLKT